MAQAGLPEDQSAGAAGKSRYLFRRRGAYALRPSCRPHLGQERRDPGGVEYRARYRMSLISAVTSRGHMRFMIKETGGVNAEGCIEFPRRLLIGSKNRIFIIAP